MVCNEQLWRIQESGTFVVFVVYLSLFLDNMLLTVVVPIVPDILYNLENDSPGIASRANEEFPGMSQNCSNYRNGSSHCMLAAKRAIVEDIPHRFSIPQSIINENGEVGLLFASKAIVQLVMNPIVGPLTNRVGCPAPIFAGTLILIVSSLMFAYGESFTVLFAARSIQGIGSACVSVAGMAMIANRYSDDKDRSKIMGITMGGIAAGVLVGYPFGSVMYDFVGKKAPLLILALLLAVDSVLLFIFLRPRLEPERLLVGESILKLMVDPYIILVSGAICVSTLSIAVLEPCLPIWLMERMALPRWQLGTVFIPDSVGYLFGTNLFGSMAFKIGRWFTAMAAMLTVGVCALTIPLSSHVLQLVIPHFGMGLGIGVVDASLMPLLAYLVDSRYAAMYGSVYAIAQVAVCLSYSVGPLLGGHLVKAFGFPWIMRAIGICNILYCPLCFFLKSASTTEENKGIRLKSDNYDKIGALEKEGHTTYSSFCNQE